MKIRTHSWIIVAILLLSFSTSILLTGTVADQPAAKVWTDKADYHPGETVTIYGSGFSANTPVTFNVTNLKDGTTTSWSVNTDSNGNLTTTYQIDPQGAPLYKIDATDGLNHATNTFTDTSITVTNERTSITKNADETLYAMVGDQLTISANYAGWYAISFEPSPPAVSNPNICFVPPTDGSGSHSAHGSIGPLSFTIPGTFDSGTTVSSGNYLVGIWDDSMLVANPYVNIIIGSSQVSQPITITMANGAPSATVTVTGGNPSPSTFQADGNQHTISIDSGASFTLSFSNTGNTRNGFSVSGSFSATSNTYAASTTPISVTAYRQVQTTFAYSTQDLSVIPAGNHLGSYLSCGNTLYFDSGATYGTCSPSEIWHDYNMMTSFTSHTAASDNEKWSTSWGGGNYGAGTTTIPYYHQYKFNLKYDITGGSTGSAAPTLTAKQSGVVYEPSLTTTDTSYWLDAGSAWSVTNPLVGSGATQQWYSSQTISGTVSSTSPTTAGTSQSFTYTHQYQVTFTQTGILDSAGTNAVLTLGSTTYDRTNLPSNLWVDAGTAFTWSSTVAGGTNERFAITPTSGTITGTSYSVTYYHQWYLTVNGGHSITFGTASRFGDQWYDDGTSTTVSSDSVYNRGSGTGQRVSAWNIDSGSGITVATSGTVTTTSISMSAYHSVTFTAVTQYQVTLDTTATTALSFISTPTITGDNYWYDSNTPIYVILHGVWGRTGGTGSRLATGAINGIDSGISPTTNDVTMYSGNIDNHAFITSTSKNQYQVSFTSSGLGGDATGNLATFSVSSGWYSGASSPLSVSGGSIWVDAGSTVTYSLTSAVTSSVSSKQYIKTSTDASPLTGLSGPTAIIGSYNTQYQVAFTYTTNDGSTIASGNQIGTYQAQGTSHSITAGATYGSTSPASAWVDAGTDVVSFQTYTAGSGTERWTLPTTPLQYSVSSSDPIFPFYNHQYYLTVNNGGHGTAEGEGWYDAGSSAQATLTSPIITSGTTRYVFNGWTGDASGTDSPSNSITMNAAKTATATWKTQYLLTMATNLGTTTPTVGDSWYDAGSSVTLGITPPAVGSNEQYILVSWSGSGTGSYSGTNPAPSITMNGPITETATLTHQWYITVNNGGHGTPSQGSQWVNDGGSFSTSVTSPADVVSGVTQWVTGTTTLSISSVSSAQTLTFTWTQQYAITPYYTVTGGGNPTVANVVHYTSNGASLTATPTLGASGGTAFWADSGTVVTYTSPINGGSGERWQIASDDTSTHEVLATVTQSQDITATYIHQYQVTFGYSTSDASNIASGTVLGSYNQYGSSNAITSDGIGAVTPANAWVDAGTGTIQYQTAAATSGTERWALSSPHSIDVTSSAAIIESGYNHQYQLTVTSAHGSPTGAGWYNAGATATFGVTTPDGTAGTRYVLINWISNSADGYNGAAASPSVTMNGPVTETANWQTQYQITFVVNPSDSGITSPSGTAWENAGALAVSAVQNGPYTFSGWSATGSITFENSATTTTTAALAGPGTITATFSPNVATHLVFNVIGGQTAGTQFTITVTAKDAYGNTVPWYTGTVHFTSSGSKAILPSDSTLTDGIGTFQVTLKTAGTQTITATDNTISGTSDDVTVAHAATVAAVTITPTTSSVTAGQTKTFTATAYDSYGNVWGDVTSSTTWSINSTAGGSWSTNVYNSSNAGQWTVTGTYASTTYTASLTVNPGDVDHFVISAPSSATAGTAFRVTIIAKDAFNNNATSFTGTVYLAASRGIPSPSASGVFTAGVWSGSVTLPYAGSITLDAIDSDTHTGTSAAITVNVAPTPTPTATPTPNPTASPIPTSTTNLIPVDKDNSTIYMAINSGSTVTVSQFSSAILTYNQTTGKTTIAFTMTGTNGTAGYGNLTISKSDIPYGASPIIYIDGVQAENQGYTEDSANFYIWFTTHFSTHQVTIEFTEKEAAATSLWLVLAFVVAFIVVILVVVTVALRRRKKRSTQ